jgi:hypothetical protein
MHLGSRWKTAGKQLENNWKTANLESSWFFYRASPPGYGKFDLFVLIPFRRELAEVKRPITFSI